MRTSRLPILYFGNDWDAENRTSSHHLAHRLSRAHDLYYFECPGMRAPNGSGRDLMKIVRKLGRFLRGPRQVLPGLKVQTLLQIPLHRFALVRWLNAKLMVSTVRWVMWRQRIRRPITWFLIPHVAALVGRLDERLSVYYCTDSHASLPNVDVQAIAAMDEMLTRKADIVFVASKTLLQDKLALNPNTYHSPHGVDVDHFGRAQLPGDAPPDIRHLGHPLVGFFGLIEHWIDLDLVAFLAVQRPEWNFLMIGRVAVPSEKIPRLPNLHFIGQRPYERLPDFGRQFDAAIIPYRLNQQVFHANPLKLREYLAMGKPVVSVRTPETEQYGDVIEIADGQDAFLKSLDRVIQQRETPETIQRRSLRVAPFSWDARVRQILRIVEREAEGDYRGCATNEQSLATCQRSTV
jgi:glycosyltransferase involved in cell wall biosynthesis